MNQDNLNTQEINKLTKADNSDTRVALELAQWIVKEDTSLTKKKPNLLTLYKQCLSIMRNN